MHELDPALAIRKDNGFWFLGATHLVLVAALLPIPLFGLLHAESSAVVATVAFFATGVTAVRFFRAGRTFREVVVAGLLLALIPLLVLTVSMLWRPNCGYLQGFLLYTTFVFPSVVFGVALSKFVVARFRRSQFAFVLLGFLILVGSMLFDVGFHPQFYTYNHVFGAVLGPIYDEELSIRPGLFIFRSTTLIWSAFLIYFSTDHRAARRRLSRALAALLAIALLAVIVIFPGLIGLNTTYRSIERELPVTFESDHFITHFSDGQYSDEEVSYLSALQEFRYAQMHSKLGVSVSERIHVYLYADETSKGTMTGSRSTSITPVWLARPQIHMLAKRHESTFSHELVHVFSREFGLPIIRANPSIGLVEGLAGALEAPDGLPTADAQIAASFRESSRSEKDLSEIAIQTMSPIGFWSGRGAVSYTVASSFTSFLIKEVGVQKYKRLYGALILRSVLDKDLSIFADQWASELLQTESPDSLTGLLAAARFSVPSLFEQRCPHHVSAEQRLFRRVSLRLIEGDTLGAKSLLARPHRSEPGLTYVEATLAMADDHPLTALELARRGDFIGLSLIEADAGQAMGQDASFIYDSLLAVVPQFAGALRAAIVVRKIALLDSARVQLLYVPGQRACFQTVEITARWACARYLEEAKDFSGAAGVLSGIVIPEDFPTTLADEFNAYVSQRQANDWLLAGALDLADAAFKTSLSTNHVARFSYLGSLLTDRVTFLDFVRNRNSNALPVD